MGQTNRRYPVVEVALSVRSKTPSADGMDRIQEGDIVALRTHTGYVGSREVGPFLWLQITGLEENDMAALTEPVADAGQLYQKRRYRIPLDRLQQQSGIDLARVRDVADTYQPFYVYDPETLTLAASQKRPLEVHGLVYDTLIGAYL